MWVDTRMTHPLQESSRGSSCAGSASFAVANVDTTAFRDHRITRKQAAQRIGVLELRFAAFTVKVNEVRPTAPPLRALQAEYAHTYILEDAYLSALVSGLANDELGDLPNTRTSSERRSSRGALG